MKTLVPAAFLALFVLHHDLWLWDNAGLVFGALPAGLAYHLGFSIVAAGLWFAATRFNWPQAWEDWANREDDAG